MLQIAFIRENQEKVIKALANMDAKVLLKKCYNWTKNVEATQIELDNILSRSNKLSRYWRIDESRLRKSESCHSKRKTVLNKERKQA
jgi:seryl-tRNA synthetase